MSLESQKPVARKDNINSFKKFFASEEARRKKGCRKRNPNFESFIIRKLTSGLQDNRGRLFSDLYSLERNLRHDAVNSESRSKGKSTRRVQYLAERRAALVGDDFSAMLTSL